MKIKINESRLKEIIAEEMAALEDKHHMDHVDEEGGMAKRQLEQLAEYAMELSAMLQEDTQLEGWVQSKITLAQDYISKVKHYLRRRTWHVLGWLWRSCSSNCNKLRCL